MGLARAILLAGLAALALAAVPAPAAAQSLFDFFFNGARRPTPPPTASAYADPQTRPLCGQAERSRAARR